MAARRTRAGDSTSEGRKAPPSGTLTDPSDRFRWPGAQVAINNVLDIIDPAAELFAERGYANSTMDELAQRIKVAKPTLYAYAGSKTAILEAVFDHFLLFADQSLADAAKGETAPAQLSVILQSWSWASIEMPSYYEVYNKEYRSLPETAREHVREIQSKYFRIIRTFVETGQLKNEITQDIDSTYLTFSLIAISTTPGQWITPGLKLTWEDVARQACLIFGQGVFVSQKGVPALYWQPGTGEFFDRRARSRR